MSTQIPSGSFYRRNLPHYRSVGKIYHVRFSIHPDREFLCDEKLFQIIEERLFYPHRKSCLLYAYVIMPNHTHALIQPLPRVPGWEAWCDYRRFHRLEDIVGGIKTFSSNKINKYLGRSGAFWLRESFDREIRNDKDLTDTIEYVHNNPIRWGIVERPEDYRWSSAATIYSGRREFEGWFNL